MIEELECGCAIDADFAGYGASSDMTNYKNWRVVYCPKHAAAPDLFEALEDAFAWIEATVNSDDYYAPAIERVRFEKIKAVLELAAK